MDPALKELMEGSGEDEIEAIVRLDPEGTLPPHVRVVSRFGEIATVRLPRERIAETWADESVVSLKAARPFGLDPDPLPFDADAEASERVEDQDDTRRPEGLDATGRGVIVAVLDWGFDFAHPNFRRRDGSTRALALWDQSVPGAGPQPYGYGRVHTREEIDRALRSDEPYRALGYHPASGDPTGYGAHGTHVLDIAAGNGRAEGSPSGIAPEADLLFVHLATRGTEGRANLGDSVTLLEALDWVARQAGDRPWVVNLSVGRHGGPHTGLTLVEQGIDALLGAGPGRAVVQSTGNYFAANVHASGYLRPGQERTLRWWTDRADVTPNELEIWYPGVDAFEVEVRSPSQDTEAQVRVPLGGQASIVVDGREVGRVYHRAKDPGNGDNHIDVFLYPQAPAGCWQVVLIGEDVVDGRFHAWVERDPGCPTCQSRLDPADADPTTTIGTIANGFRSIAVGAYDAHSEDRRLGAFSSSGPTRDGRLKPDLLAPGVSVLAARSASLELGSDTPLLTRNSGTSMAAPHVTGTVALMFEVAPRPLTIQETRKLLLSTSREARFDAEPAARLGSGYLDIERAVEAARSFAVPAAPVRETVEGFEEILEQAAQEPEPAWIVPEETEAFDDGGEPGLEEAMEDEREAHPCGCGAREPEAGCGCHGAHSEEEEPGEYEDEESEEMDETTRWEPEWEEMESEPSWVPEPALEPVPPPPPVTGWWMGALSPADLFDGMLAGGAVRRHLESSYEVLALPFEIPLDPPREGDLVVRRALGEGSLARMTMVAGEWDVALDPRGRMPFDQLLVRPRAARPAWRDTEWEEARPGGVPYVRWIQESLNRILGLQLKVDGDAGPKTREAIKTFQRRKGLAPDGVVGRKTEQALIAAGAAPPPGAAFPVGPLSPPPAPPVAVTPASLAQPDLTTPCPGSATVLDNFDTDKATLKPAHQAALDALARTIDGSQDTTTPVHTVCIVGHTDDRGDDPHNIGLGKKRAAAVQAELIRKVDALRPGLSARLRFDASTQGESKAAGDNTTAAGRAANRRVEVFLNRQWKTLCLTPPVSADDPAALDLHPVGERDFDGGRVRILGQSFPLRGNVFYPAQSAGRDEDFKSGLGPVPVVFLLHGRHAILRNPNNKFDEACPDDNPPSSFVTIPNFRGYEYFQRLLARMGIISVSVDCNETNCDDSMGFAGNIQLRARLLLAAVRHFQRLNTAPSPFNGKLDFSHTGFFGHSRGGEAVLVAAEAIGSLGGVTLSGVFSLAPTDARASSGKPRGFAFATLLPAADGDVRGNDGARFYDQATPGPFKCQLYIDGANHNFFNTEWPFDDGKGAPILGDTVHRALLSAYGCAFFRNVLLGHATLKFLRGNELPPGVPAANVHLSFEQSAALTVDDHENKDVALNALNQASGPSAGFAAQELDFVEGASHGFSTFFGNTVGLVAQSSSATAQFRSALAAPADLSGKEVWIRAAEIYNGTTVPPGGTGYLIGLEDAAGRIALADSNNAGGLPRPWNRRAADLASRRRTDRTKTMLTTFRYPAGCFVGNGFDMTKVRAVVIRLDRGDNRPIAFDQLQIV